MKNYINNFSKHVTQAILTIPHKEIAKALSLLEAVYERDGRIYVFGNGGSLAMATHWVGDFNKTIFNNLLETKTKRFQAIRLPSTEVELTAWANDIGYDMVFAGPLQNYLTDSDLIIAISSSGNSPNIVKAVQYANRRKVPVIGLSGFDGGKLNKLADIKILVKTKKGAYTTVECVHNMILHLMTQYFNDYFSELYEKRKGSISR
ncbi:SIS domain-containing protein [Candidatus Woesebacteria bacterium]|nr:SIS domain-containing protein [Candidatus Woesebacteria bacterium]